METEVLKNGELFRVLEYAVKRASEGQPVFEKTIESELGITDANQYKESLFAFVGGGGKDRGQLYRLMPAAFMAYLQYREMEESRSASAQAERHAKWSISIAVASIVVSIVMAMIQIFKC